MKKKNGEIIINKNIEKFVKIILAISTPFLTVLLSNRFPIKHIFIGACLSFIVFSCIIFKKIKIEKINIKKMLLVLYISLYTINIFLSFSNQNIVLFQKVFTLLFNLNVSANFIQGISGLMTVPSVVFFIYLFIEKMSKYINTFLKKLTNNEKKYLIIMAVISIVVVVFVTYNTTAFTKPFHANKLEIYDVLYTSDTGVLTYENAYLNTSHEQNDIRQPLFGVFSLPFAIVAKIISDVCFFLPQNFKYEIVLTIIQFLLTTITTIMVGKILDLKEKDKKYLYLLFSCSFPYILFNLVLEQYVIGLFYLILTIYIYTLNKYEINYMYIGAVGTMLTSGIIFPVITKFKNLKQWLKNVLKCFFTLISILIISGQFPQLFTGLGKLNYLTNSFAGKITFSDKIIQFTHFVKGIFISEQGDFKILNGHPSYQLIEFDSVSIIGIIIVVLIVISFILNRKNKIARISFLWVLFSVCILLLFGWGAQENGFILYSLYFAWAYLILYFLLLKRVIKNRKIFVVILLISIMIMLVCNINEIINVFRFALKYY